MQSQKKIRIAMADDHTLFLTTLAAHLNTIEEFQVAYQFPDGQQLVNTLSTDKSVDIILLDIKMPVLNGFETAEWLKNNLPDIPVLILSMFDSEISLIPLLRKGVRGFVQKTANPDELKKAILSVIDSGFYYSDHSTAKLIELFRNTKGGNTSIQNTMLSTEDITFLQLACSDLTYIQIASKLNITPRCVESLRNNLFIKLDVKSRVGLAISAIKNGIANI